jgi:hypothetical protein
MPITGIYTVRRVGQSGSTEPRTLSLQAQDRSTREMPAVTSEQPFEEHEHFGEEVSHLPFQQLLCTGELHWTRELAARLTQIRSRWQETVQREEVQQQFEQTFSRLVTAAYIDLPEICDGGRSVQNSTASPCPEAESQAENQSSSALLALLADAPSSRRNSIREFLLRLSTPSELLESSLLHYQSTRRECFLIQAVSLLEAFGHRAWPALRNFANSGRWECELFAGAVARCPGVPSEQRMRALRSLARSPHADVRDVALGHIAELETESRHVVSHGSLGAA